MQFKINPRIFSEYPGASVGVVVAKGINNSKELKEVMDLLKKQQDEVLKQIHADQISAHAHIAPWRQAYTKFGAKPKDHLSSIENLLRRVIKRQPFRSINTLVDLYNVVSLKYMLPAGGEDLDTIKGDIELTFAGKNEQAVFLLGEKEAKAPNEGEVFYKDENGAICRRWNWKEADRTKITPDTKNAFFVLEILPPVKREFLEAATHELAALIQKFCNGDISVAILDQQHPSIDLKKNTEYITQEPIRKIEISESPYQIGIQKAESIEAKPLDDSAEHQIRLEKLKSLEQVNIKPWPEAKDITATCAHVHKEFDPLILGANGEGKAYAVAGRIRIIRHHGKASFVVIQDQSGQLQLYIKQDDIGDKAYEQFKHLIDVGDIVWAQGNVFKTKMGEITIKVNKFELLSKCLFPLPEKFHGLHDIETIYRQRYLDLITNQASRERFAKRSGVIRAFRNYLDNHGFMEVETPMLHPIPGGAAAKPFITHHNALGNDFYLRIAPELYLKRLVVGGFEQVYEINRNFRNEGISTRHNPEFTMLEMYWAHHEYHFIMKFLQDMMRDAVQQVCGVLKVPFNDFTIDFAKPFTITTIKDAVLEYGKYTQKDIAPELIDARLKEHAITMANANASWGEKIYALFEKIAEHRLIQPTFVTEFPIEVSPLAKRDEKDPRFAARFELFIAGMEISNGFNELNDPFDQATRFKQQAGARAGGDVEAHHFDAEYIHALEYGLPPTVGVGIGIDRFAMLVTNAHSIKDVILFPTLKKKE